MAKKNTAWGSVFYPAASQGITLSVGIIVALLAGSIQFMVIYHNRAERFDAIINNVNTYLKSYFHDLRQTIDGLQRCRPSMVWRRS